MGSRSQLLKVENRRYHPSPSEEPDSSSTGLERNLAVFHHPVPVKGAPEDSIDTRVRELDIVRVCRCAAVVITTGAGFNPFTGNPTGATGIGRIEPDHEYYRNHQHNNVGTSAGVTAGTVTIHVNLQLVCDVFRLGWLFSRRTSSPCQHPRCPK